MIDDLKFSAQQQDIVDSIQGNFHLVRGITLAQDSNMEWHNYRATEKHEMLHQELTDMSNYGWFQKLLVGLYRNELVPTKHRWIYGRVLSKTMSNCFLVHEGLATYREAAWYSGWTSNTKRYVEHLTPEYHTALTLVMVFLPDYSEVTREDQDAIHGICDAFGIYLLNPPILDYYSDWGQLEAKTLQFIDTDSPDQRLKELAPYGSNIKTVLMDAMVGIKKKLKSNQGLDHQFFIEWIDKTVVSLIDAVPDLTVSRYFEFGTEVTKLLKRWNKDICFSYARDLYSAEIESHFETIRPVPEERILESSFGVLNAAHSFEGVHIRNLRVNEFLEVISRIHVFNRIAFALVLPNPSKNPILLPDNNLLGSQSLLGLLFDVGFIDGKVIKDPMVEDVLRKKLTDRDVAMSEDDREFMRAHLKMLADIAFKEKLGNVIDVVRTIACYETMSFDISMNYLKQIFTANPHNSIIQYMYCSNYSKLIENQCLLPGLYILKIAFFSDFQDIFGGEVYDFFFIESYDKKAFCFYKTDVFFFFLTTLLQEMKIAELITERLPIDQRSTQMPTTQGLNLSLEQVAALAFYGANPIPNECAPL